MLNSETMGETNEGQWLKMHIVPGVGGLEVTEMGMKALNHVVTNYIDHVHLGEAGPQLLHHFPEIFRQHLIQLALISTQRHIP